MNAPASLSGKSLSPHLRIAVLTGVQVAVRIRIDRGDDVNATDDRGRSPLMLAASRGHVETCRVLLEAGADPTARDREGNAALGLAIEGRHSGIVALLHERLAASADSPSDGLKETSADYPVLPGGIEAQIPRTEDPEPDDDDFPLGTWEPDPESPPPLADPEAPARAGAVQHAISIHVPVDSDGDWSDVDIDLPDISQDRRQRRILEGEREVAIRALLLDGLRDGRLPVWRITDAAGTGAVESDTGLEAHLLLILGDLGILVDGDPEELHDHADPLPIDDNTADLVDDVLVFLSDLASTANDPQSHYNRELGREALLSRADEVELGTAIEGAMNEAITAVANSPAAIVSLLSIASEIKRGDALTETAASGVSPILIDSGDPDDPLFEDVPEPNPEASQTGIPDADQEDIKAESADLSTRLAPLAALLPRLSEGDSHAMFEALRELGLSLRPAPAAL